MIALVCNRCGKRKFLDENELPSLNISPRIRDEMERIGWIKKILVDRVVHFCSEECEAAWEYRRMYLNHDRQIPEECFDEADQADQKDNAVPSLIGDCEVPGAERIA